MNMKHSVRNATDPLVVISILLALLLALFLTACKDEGVPTPRTSFAGNAVDAFSGSVTFQDEHRGR